MSKAIQRELVTCVKVALQLDWQLSHLDLRCSNNFTDSFSVTGAVKGENKKLLPCLKASDWTTASDCTLIRVAAANFLSWHSVTHRLSASSHHASCPCSCSCEQQTPCHKQEQWWYARELSAHAVASWTRAHNPDTQKHKRTSFFYGCQITYPNSTGDAVTGFPTVSLSDHFLTPNYTKIQSLHRF